MEHIEGSRVINGPTVGEKAFKHIDPGFVENDPTPPWLRVPVLVRVPPGLITTLPPPLVMLNSPALVNEPLFVKVAALRWTKLEAVSLTAAPVLLNAAPAPLVISPPILLMVPED